MALREYQRQELPLKGMTIEQVLEEEAGSTSSGQPPTYYIMDTPGGAQLITDGASSNFLSEPPTGWSLVDNEGTQALQNAAYPGALACPAQALLGTLAEAAGDSQLNDNFVSTLAPTQKHYTCRS